MTSLVTRTDHPGAAASNRADGAAGRLLARDRPPVSVVVPFRGDRDEGEALLAALWRLELADVDEVIVSDNTEDGVLDDVRRQGHAEIRGVHAAGEPSSYHARNAGADLARGEWLLFLDADCRPRPSLLQDFFAEPIDDEVGAVAGAVVGALEQRSLVARYSRARGHLSQEGFLANPYKPFAVTANLLVRRSAWASLGGFLEGERSGGDADLCWRLQAAGWVLAYRPAATVEHLHRERVSTLARQMARYGAGRAWLNRRYPGAGPRLPVARLLARCAAGTLVFALSGQGERATFKALDAVSIAADGVGYLMGNAAPAAPIESASHGVVITTDAFPRLSETFVPAEAHALRRLGAPTRVEAVARAARPGREWASGLRVSYLEDEGIARKLAALAWLVARHPVGCARDLVDRRRWSQEEPVRPLRWLAPAALRLRRGRERHLHAHFATSAALDAMRLSRTLGLTYSVAAHAYDIFAQPRNLREKLERAAFVATACEYNAVHLREAVAPEHAHRIHKVVVGVDGERFSRRRPHPTGRAIVSVGRLVEKKGFAYLVEAAALLRERGAPPERLTIVGEGPLRAELAELAARLGVSELELTGPREPAEVREILEAADLFALPCVVAADGDRDSMPVVVKEALAMEIPVVATDEVGLPEVVGSGWGRLVPPHDAAALADALEELLALSPDERAAMGRAGRAFVLKHANLERETEKLVELIDGVAAH